MNNKKSKAIRRKAKEMFIEWLREMTPEGEEATKINKNNMHLFLPEETHYYANRQHRLSSYSLKWFEKKLKDNPNLTLEILNKNLQEEQERKSSTGYWS